MPTTTEPRTYFRPTCDQCEILVINNVICHETGCPDSWKYATKNCAWCGTSFDLERRRQECCSDECAREFYGTDM